MNHSETLVLRPATLQDDEGIARVLPDLGYASTAAEVRQRIAPLANQTDQILVVAALAGQVVGLCQAQRIHLVATDGYVEVHALVVLRQWQGQGIGRALVNAALQWAATVGASRVRLRSGVHREDSHRFYEAIGFTRQRASYAFEVQLADKSDKINGTYTS